MDSSALVSYIVTSIHEGVQSQLVSPHRSRRTERMNGQERRNLGRSDFPCSLTVICVATSGMHARPQRVDGDGSKKRGEVSDAEEL